MKKNAFTLIELLSVIVILAIIALIATPVILGIINNVKEESNKRSIEMYAKAIENAVEKNQLTSNDKIIGSFNTKDGKNLILRGEEEPSLIVDYDGNVVCDIVEIQEDGTIYLGGCTVNGSNNKYIYNKTVQLLEQTESFEKDSWETILYNVKTGNIGVYKVGETKEISLTGFTNEETNSNGLYTIRIANTSTPEECDTSGFSQTACGFVIEFEDIITKHNMNPVGEYKGIQYDLGWNVDGYPASSMYKFVNGDIFNSLPKDIKDVIIETKVVSGHGKTSGETNFVSTDKLYLLSTQEVWGSNPGYDTSADQTRQLDYYKNKGVTTSSYSGAIKKYNGSSYYWWLRSANSNSTYIFYIGGSSGVWSINTASNANGVAVAFRIG